MSLQDELLDQELDDILTDSYRKRGLGRCAALIPPASVALRSRHSPTDRRCRRAAHTQAGENWFCRQHAPIWQTHYRILDRILSIPARD